MIIEQPAGKATDVPPQGVTELRVHGVGGTPPELILANPHLKRVSGDDLVGFYRPADDQPADPVHQEACSWGKITAASASQALWLLLMPFALANLAGWTHPAVPGRELSDESTAERKIKTLVRLFGISVTIGFVLTLTNIVLDLFAFQCGSLPACAAQRWWLTPFEGLPDSPGARLAIGTLACFGFLQLLAWASRASYQTLETFTPEDPAQPEEPSESSDRELHPADVGLEHPDFWRGNGPVGRLRDLHMTAGVATLATVTAFVTAPFVRDGVAAALSRLAGFAGLVLLLASCRQVVRPEIYRRSRNAHPKQFAYLKRIAYAVLAVVLVLGALGGGAPAVEPRLAALDVPNQVFFATQALLLLSMFFIHIGRRHKNLTEPIQEPAFQGFGAFAVCSISLFLLTSVWAGAVVRLADSLGFPAVAGAPGCGPGQTRFTEGGEPVLCYALYHQKTAIVSLVVLSALLILGIRLGTWLRAQGRANFDEVLGDLRTAGHEPDIEHPATKARIESVAQSYSLPRLVMDSDSLLLRVVLIGTGVALAQHFLVLVPGVNEMLSSLEGWTIWATIAAAFMALIGCVVIKLRGGRTPQLYVAMALALAVSVISPAMTRQPILINTASWLMTLLPLLVSAGFYAALRNPKLRRGVGTAWDVLTFWPRHFHPFAPPCYGERLIPQLRYRLEYLTGAQTKAPEGRVLLSAHSQGTVVAAATMMQVSPRAAQRTALFTYGSPIEILYHRIFPAYFGPGAVAAIAAKMSPGSIEHPWQHFYCRTDPLGNRLSELGPLPEAGELQVEPITCLPNTQLFDPYPWTGLAGEPPRKMGRHSAYLDQEQFRRRTAIVVDQLAGSLGNSAAPAGAADSVAESPL